eukprot:758104-Hanusia_phi.AAC.2
MEGWGSKNGGRVMKYHVIYTSCQLQSRGTQETLKFDRGNVSLGRQGYRDYGVGQQGRGGEQSCGGVVLFNHGVEWGGFGQ